MTSDERSFAWPGEARIAVVVTCLLETWSEGKWPPFSVQTTALKPGTPDLAAAMTWGTYGVRAGVWRLPKILDDTKVPATFVANARALELDPRAATQIVRSGHEIAGHSYTQDNQPGVPDCRRGTGRDPAHGVGHRGASPASGRRAGSARCSHSTERTESYRRRGFPVVRRLQQHRPAVLHFPRTERSSSPCRTTDFADHRVLRAIRGTGSRSTRIRSTTSTRNEPTSYLNITVHCHFGGLLLMAAQDRSRSCDYIRGNSRSVAPCATTSSPNGCSITRSQNGRTLIACSRARQRAPGLGSRYASLRAERGDHVCRTP